MSDEFMVEDTNQSETEDNLFTDDLFESDTNDENEESEETTEETTEEIDNEESTTEDTDSAPAKLKAKFLGEEKEFTPDEAVPLIQKGLNYDHVAAENQALKAKVKQFETDQNLANRKDAVAEMVSRGMDEDDALERVMLMEENARLKALETEKEQTNTRQEFFNAFTEKYPDSDHKSWSDEMKAAYKDGGTNLETVYLKEKAQKAEEKAKQLEAENAALKTNNKNKEKSLGSVKGEGSKAGVDPFLQGLFGK